MFELIDVLKRNHSNLETQGCLPSPYDQPGQVIVALLIIRTITIRSYEASLKVQLFIEYSCLRHKGNFDNATTDHHNQQMLSEIVIDIIT